MKVTLVSRLLYGLSSLNNKLGTNIINYVLTWCLFMCVLFMASLLPSVACVQCVGLFITDHLISYHCVHVASMWWWFVTSSSWYCKCSIWPTADTTESPLSPLKWCYLCQLRQWDSSMLAEGQVAVTKIHVNAGRVTSGRWPTVTPDSYKCFSREFTFCAALWLELEVSLKAICPSAAFWFYAPVTIHLLWGPGCYVKGSGKLLGLQDVSCVPMVTKSVSCCAVFDVSCQSLS